MASQLPINSTIKECYNGPEQPQEKASKAEACRSSQEENDVAKHVDDAEKSQDAEQIDPISLAWSCDSSNPVNWPAARQWSIVILLWATNTVACDLRITFSFKNIKSNILQGYWQHRLRTSAVIHPGGPGQRQRFIRLIFHICIRDRLLFWTASDCTSQRAFQTSRCALSELCSLHCSVGSVWL